VERNYDDTLWFTRRQWCYYTMFTRFNYLFPVGIIWCPIFTLLPVRKGGIEISVSACLSVCVYICLCVCSHISKTTRLNFTKFSVLRPNCGCGAETSDDNILYLRQCTLLPVLWMVSCFLIIGACKYDGPSIIL